MDILKTKQQHDRAVKKAFDKQVMVKEGEITKFKNIEDIPMLINGEVLTLASLVDKLLAISDIQLKSIEDNEKSEKERTEDNKAFKQMMFDSRIDIKEEAYEYTYTKLMSRKAQKGVI